MPAAAFKQTARKVLGTLKPSLRYVSLLQLLTCLRCCSMLGAKRSTISVGSCCSDSSQTNVRRARNISAKMLNKCNPTNTSFLNITSAPCSDSSCSKVLSRPPTFQFVDFGPPSRNSRKLIPKDTLQTSLCERRHRGRTLRDIGCQTDRHLAASLTAELAFNSALERVQDGTSDSHVLHALLALARSSLNAPHRLVKEMEAGASVLLGKGDRPEHEAVSTKSRGAASMNEN